MARILVLGGRGYLGTAVCAALRGHEVWTFDRKPGGQRHRQGSITDPAAVDKAAEGMDALVNLVGLSPVKDLPASAYRAVHEGGAANALAACVRHGCRLVHISALGADPDGTTAYIRTKGLGERAVLESRVPSIVLRPSLIYDEGNELVAMMRRWIAWRIIPGLSARMQPIHRDDLALLIALAAEGKVAEERLDAAGPERLTLASMARKLAEARGRRCLAVPPSLVRLGLALASRLPGTGIGPDQARAIQLESVTDDNGAARYLDLTRYTDWIVRFREKGEKV